MRDERLLSRLVGAPLKCRGLRAEQPVRVGIGQEPEQLELVHVERFLSYPGRARAPCDLGTKPTVRALMPISPDPESVFPQIPVDSLVIRPDDRVQEIDRGVILLVPRKRLSEREQEPRVHTGPVQRVEGLPRLDRPLLAEYVVEIADDDLTPLLRI